MEAPLFFTSPSIIYFDFLNIFCTFLRLVYNSTSAQIIVRI